MMGGIREFLQSKAGTAVGVVLGVVAVASVVWSFKANLGQSEAASLSRDRVFVCAETGEAFDYELTLETKIPVRSPHSGKNTGYPAELCYWTKNGTIKDEPTAVLLNTYVQKPEPTFCPDCGRRVVPRNPYPDARGKPPPTETEWKARGGGPSPQGVQE